MRIRGVALFGSALLTASLPCGRPSRVRPQRAVIRLASGEVTNPASVEEVVEAPECPGSKPVLCIQDTAYVQHREGDGNVEAVGTILWFGRRGDSLVLSAHASAVQTTIGDDKDAQHNNVPHFHGRVPKDGTITIWTSMDEERGDSVPYSLRVEDLPAQSPLLSFPAGARAHAAVIRRF